MTTSISCESHKKFIAGLTDKDSYTADIKWQ